MARMPIDFQAGDVMTITNLGTYKNGVLVNDASLATFHANRLEQSPLYRRRCAEAAETQQFAKLRAAFYLESNPNRWLWR